MQGRGPKPEPLTNHPRYEKVYNAMLEQRHAGTPESSLLACVMLAQQVHDADLLFLQIRDLNSGTFGFVQLARDKQTGELIACKFIERGDKVRYMIISDSLSMITLRLSDVRHAVVVWSSGDQSCLGTDKQVLWLLSQVTKYVEREILNHRCLVHPHIVQFREVSATLLTHCLRGLTSVGLDQCWTVLQLQCLSDTVTATHSLAHMQRPQQPGSACMSMLVCCCSSQVFLTPQHLGISMEFAPGGDMFEYVVKKNGLREEEARWFFQQLIVGLDYCHRMVSSKP